METPKFTAELKAKWIEALRSGKYGQGRRRLFFGSGYCCLGVFGHIQGVSNAVLAEFNTRIGSDGDEDTRGISPLDCVPLDYRQVLSDMNDSGASFEKIADYIESHIPAATQPTND